MKTVIVLRYKVEYNFSLGHCFIKHESGVIQYIGATLERGWRNNQKQVSCVPEGEYPLRLEYSPRFDQDLWELYDVPNRSECKFHAANYWEQLNGCIALGSEHRDINFDGVPDIPDSRVTMAKFHGAMGWQKTAKVIIKSL